MSHLNTNKHQRIHALVHAIVQFFEANRDRNPGVDRVLRKVQTLNLSLDAAVDSRPHDTRHSQVLSEAIEDVTAPELQGIVDCLKAARYDLAWREDNAEYYAPDADLGEGYNNCNLHSLLVGPNACGFEAHDFCLGLFMLGTPNALSRSCA